MAGATISRVMGWGWERTPASMFDSSEARLEKVPMHFWQIRVDGDNGSPEQIDGAR